MGENVQRAKDIFYQTDMDKLRSNMRDDDDNSNSVQEMDFDAEQICNPQKVDFQELFMKGRSIDPNSIDAKLRMLRKIPLNVSSVFDWSDLNLKQQIFCEIVLTYVKEMYAWKEGQRKNKPKALRILLSERNTLGTSGPL